MKYIPNLNCKEDLLKELGEDANYLFSDIPDNLKKKIELPEPLSEIEVRNKVKGILSKNKKLVSFLGGGVWNHYIPAHVPQLAGRSEFATAYTPYQPEISQGAQQALWEYQSLIAEITGLGAVNSSLYDWSSALGEAGLMCTRVTQRDEFLIPDIISPERKKVLETWMRGAGLKVIEVAHNPKTGQLDLDDLKSKLGEHTSGVYLENPSYLGFFQEAASEIAELAHENESLFVVGVDPISLGIVKSPGDCGADIAIGDAQGLGNAPNYGGPLLGLFAVREEMNLMRKMPGRIIGETTDTEGKRGYVMTLQTREQHIRREKATSNVCTNGALIAINTAIYLSTLGKSGLKEVGETCMSNANHAMKRINELDGFEAPIFESTHFKEFTVRSEKVFEQKLLDARIHPGKALNDFENTSLWCVTEQHTKENINQLIEVLSNV